uniref:Uncharacterized protein n=1 Tax=Arcella intermedia TaxID=1963864 RepID=A0A6B2L6W4_9EUKA
MVEGSRERLREALKENVVSILKHYPPAKREDPSLYTGSLGIYAALRRVLAHEGALGMDVPELKMHTNSYLEHAKKSISQSSAAKRYTLHCGDAGILTYLELYSSPDLNNQKMLCGFLPEVLKDSFESNEVLYGRTGYLCALLPLYMKEGSLVDDHIVSPLVTRIMEEGYKLGTKECPLNYAWHGKEYWGAAHGLVGIFYTLLHQKIFQNFILKNEKWRKDLIQSMDYLCGMLGSDGSFPSRLKGSNLTQWCHGPTGMVFLMCRAYQTLNDEKYRKAAILSAQAIWAKGFLTKGGGLCHGISGNAYALLAVYKVTEDVDYLHQALQFAVAYAQSDISRYFAVPDRPYSLYEGKSGMVSLYVDLLVDPKNATMPGYQDL